MLTIILALTLLLVLWYTYKADTRIVRISADIPGPPTLPLIGNIHQIPRNGKDTLVKRGEWFKEYGPVVRLWVGRTLWVLLSDPKDVGALLINVDSQVKESRVYTFLYPWLGFGLLTSAGEMWRNKRKALTPTFHFTILERFLEVFNKNGRILLECLEGSVQKSVDIQTFISRFTLDNICETAMGVKGDAQTNQSSPYVKAVGDYLHLLMTRNRRPWIYPEALWSAFGYKKKAEELLFVLNSSANRILKENESLYKDKNFESLNGSKTKTTFIELLMKMRKEGSTAFKTDSDIRDEVNTFMFEGQDTTATALGFTLANLAKYPQIQEAVHDELKEKFSKTTDIKMEDLQEMKYLERFIKESLRLYPSVPFIERKLTKDIRLPSGYTLPAGTEVAVSIYYTHRNTEYYDDPEKFNPDRFLSEINNQRHPFSYIPFSAGPRSCIGQKFATMEMKSVLAKLILNYKFESVDKREAELCSDIVLRNLNGHWMKIAKRL